LQRHVIHKGADTLEIVVPLHPGGAAIGIDPVILKSSSIVEGKTPSLHQVVQEAMGGSILG